MKNQVTIMDFTGVYENESFYKKKPYLWIDCRDIHGTYGYCDEQAYEQIAQKIQFFSPEGIHFIDSGNYHYISKVWTDKIQEPFSLVVFDHHPDMQPSLFSNLLSCGCWVKAVLDTNPYIKKVIVVGVDSNLLSKIDNKYKKRIHAYSQTELMHKEGWQRFADEYVKEPIYISIDKDILNETCIKTDWDQGILTIQELKYLLQLIVMKEQVIGIDICGECSNHIERFNQKEFVDKCNNINEILLLFLTEIAN